MGLRSHEAGRRRHLDRPAHAALETGGTLFFTRHPDKPTRRPTWPGPARPRSAIIHARGGGSRYWKIRLESHWGQPSWLLLSLFLLLLLWDNKISLPQAAAAATTATTTTTAIATNNNNNKMSARGPKEGRQVSSGTFRGLRRWRDVKRAREREHNANERGPNLGLTSLKLEPAPLAGPRRERAPKCNLSPLQSGSDGGLLGLHFILLFEGFSRPPNGTVM